MTNTDVIRDAAGQAAELLPLALATLGELAADCPQPNVRMGAARILVDAALKLAEAAHPDQGEALARLDAHLRDFETSVLEDDI